MATKFENLYWFLKIEKYSGTWNNIDPDTLLPNGTTDSFCFSNLRKTTGYGDTSENLFDADLKIGSVDYSFDQKVWENGISKIPNFSFSLTNLNQFYSIVAEANSNELQMFYGARVRLWMANGFVAGLKWNGVNWIDFDGNISATPANPSSYYSTDYSKLLFDGKINDIKFSMKETSFSVTGKSKERDKLIGTLVDVNAQDKNKAEIIPIQYGDMTDENALTPVILNEEQKNLPKVIVDNQALGSQPELFVYDKSTEKYFSVISTQNANSGNNEIQFKSETAEGTVGADNNDAEDWESDATFKADLDTQAETTDGVGNQPVFVVGDEKIGWHKIDRIKEWNGSTFTDGKKIISRGWGDTTEESHFSSDEYFFIDSDIVNSRAKIRVQLSPNGLLFSSDESTIYSNDAAGLEPKIYADGFLGAKGNFWDVIKNSQSPQLPLHTQTQLQTWTSSGHYTYAYVVLTLKWEPIGLSGKISRAVLRSLATYKTINNTSGTSNPFFNCIIRDPDGFTSSVRLDPIDVGKGEIKQYGYNGTIEVDEGSLHPSAEGVGALIGTMDDLLNNDPIGVRFELFTDWTTLPPDVASMQFQGFRLDVDLVVDAAQQNWYARTQGRFTGSLLERPTDILSNLLSYETGYSGAINTTTKRNDWKLAGAIFGKRPNYRDIVKEICFEFGMINYSAPDDTENFYSIDIETVSKTITQEMILMDGNIQAVNYSYTPSTDLYNRIEVNYQKNYATGYYGKTMYFANDGSASTDGFSLLTGSVIGDIYTRLSNVKDIYQLNDSIKSINLDFVRDLETAERILANAIRWNTRTKAIVTIRGTINDFYDLEIGNQVDLNLGGLPNRVSNAQYIIIKKRINIDKTNIELTLLEIPEAIL